MATSGTFTGGRSGTGPWLSLAWEAVSQDISNNRTKIELTLRLHSEYSMNFSSDKSGNLEGTAFNFTSGFSGTGSKVLKTKEMWVNHNSAGEGSITLNGSFAINISWGGSSVGTLTVSGTANLNDIPRASDFTAFTLSNTTLNTSTGVTVNYTLGRKSSSFSHAMTLKYGSKVIKSWSTSGTGALTQALSAAEVNTIISSVPSASSGNLTLTMQTKSGSTNVGSAKTITEGFSLNAAIKPTASGLSLAIAGSGRDKTINQYVQGISKVTASFTRTAGYGATISSSTITVKRTSDGGNSQTIGSHSGTVANPFTLSGAYSVTATVKDSRGRTASVSGSFTVQPYSPPKITKFTPTRVSNSETTVTIPYTGTWTALGTSNPSTIVITRTAAGADTNIVNSTGQTSGSVNATATATGVVSTGTHTFTMTITDSFGKQASSKVTIGTAFCELSIAKGKGIGVGKVHERGALDVAGDIYLTGGTFITPENRYASQGGGLNLRNSDIIGLNQLYFSDAMTGDNEALQFPKSTRPAAGATDFFDNKYYDSFRINEGVGYLNSVPIFASVNTILWEGGSYPNADTTITPRVPLSGCPNGWILYWSDYNPGQGVQNYNFVFHVVHKNLVGNGHNHNFMVPTGDNPTNGNLGDYTTKTLYIHNTKITGHDSNEASGSHSATDVVLRRVLMF